jgi:predicted RNA-binding protein with TRAM domain
MDDEWFEGIQTVYPGEEYEVEIEEMSTTGEGITRIKGQVVFIANAKVGDRLRVKILSVEMNKTEAEIIKKL